MVSMLMACCVTIHCCAPAGMAVLVARGSQLSWMRDGAANHLLRCGALTSIRVIGSITLVARSIPGMLLHVIHWCSPGVDFSMRFAVGFCVSIMGGALVSRSKVSMGESSITLCCALRSFC
jgi:hypothetical protein